MKHKPFSKDFPIHIADRAFLQELNETLETELQKPLEERNFDLIDECLEAISAIHGTEQMVQEYAAETIPALQAQCCRKQITKHRKPVWSIVACACAAIVLGANIWSVAAFNQNIISTTLEWVQGGFLTKLHESDPSQASSDINDPYGIKATCQALGFTPLAPTYLPDGFQRNQIDTFERTKIFTSVLFYYQNGDSRLSLQLIHYDHTEDIPPIGLPSDNTEPTKEILSGIPMLTLTEGNQRYAGFLHENTVYMIGGKNLDPQEWQNIISSLA